MHLPRLCSSHSLSACPLDSVAYGHHPARAPQPADTSARIGSSHGAAGGTRCGDTAAPARPTYTEHPRPPDDPAMMLRTLQLSCATCSVDVRLTHIDGRWLASADTPDGPSLGLVGSRWRHWARRCSRSMASWTSCSRACRTSCTDAKPPAEVPDDVDIADSGSAPDTRGGSASRQTGTR